MNVLIDTCFWFAYYDGSDKNHQEAKKIMEMLAHHRILVPYPTLYETIDTRFCRRTEWMDHFNRLIHSSRCVLVQDDKYKEHTLTMSVDAVLTKHRAISLVDMVIRQMIDDVDLKSDVVISFNCDDFVDICRKKRKIFVSDCNMANMLGG